MATGQSSFALKQAGERSRERSDSDTVSSAKPATPGGCLVRVWGSVRFWGLVRVWGLVRFWGVVCRVWGFRL